MYCFPSESQMQTQDIITHIAIHGNSHPCKNGKKKKRMMTLIVTFHVRIPLGSSRDENEKVQETGKETG